MGKRNGNKIGITAEYPYGGSAGYCGDNSWRAKSNAIKGAVVNSYVEVSQSGDVSESNTINALAEGPLSVTLYVIDSFQLYKSGIYKDQTRAYMANHALAAVAYTSQYILIKNSWGKGWGDNGFIKVARNYYGCAMHMYVGFPDLSASGVTDNSRSDPATDYRAGGEREEERECVDSKESCRYLTPYCDIERVHKACKKTCEKCDSNDGSCPSGTTR